MSNLFSMSPDDWENLTGLKVANVYREQDYIRSALCCAECRWPMYYSSRGCFCCCNPGCDVDEEALGEP